MTLAVANWFIVPDVGLGFLYFFPLILASAYISRWQIVSLALIFAALPDLYVPANFEKWPRLVFTCLAYAFVGLFVRETVIYRRAAHRHLQNFESELKQRHRAQTDQEILLNSGPAAVLTVSPDGRIVVANRAAHNTFNVALGALTGQDIGAYLQGLEQVWGRDPLAVEGTAIDCCGRKGDGQTFRAKVWISAFSDSSGPMSSVIVFADATISSLPAK